MSEVGINKDDYERIEEFIDTHPFERDPEQLCPDDDR